MSITAEISPRDG